MRATPAHDRLLDEARERFDAAEVFTVSVEEEFALVGVNPALDEFTDLAASLRADAAALATAHGRALAGSLRRSA